MKAKTEGPGAGVVAPSKTVCAIETNAAEVFEHYDDLDSGLLTAIDFSNDRAWRRSKRKLPDSMIVQDGKGRMHAIFRSGSKLLTSVTLYLPIEESEIDKLGGIDDAVDLDDRIFEKFKGVRGYHRPAIAGEFWPEPVFEGYAVLVVREKRGRTYRVLYDPEEATAYA